MAQKLWKAPREDSGTTAPAKRSPAGRNGSGKTPAKKSPVKKTDPLKLDMDVVTRGDEIQIVLPAPMAVIALSTAQARSLALELTMQAKDPDENVFTEEAKEFVSVIRMHVAEILSTRAEPVTICAEMMLGLFAHGLLDNDRFVEKFRERLRSR
jgi:hypothetical protein